MRHSTAGVFLALTLPYCVAAQLAKPGQADCLSPEKLTTAERKLCLVEQIEEAEQRIEALLQELLARSETDERKSLRTAQKAWVTYRDAECEAFARMAGFAPIGSGFGVQVGMCEQSKNAARAKDLAVQLRLLMERSGER